MVLKMEENVLIRKLVIVQGMSQIGVNRRFGWSRDSIADAIRNPKPNSCTLRAPWPRPLTNPILPLVKQWLEEDIYIQYIQYQLKQYVLEHRYNSPARRIRGTRVQFTNTRGGGFEIVD